MKSSKVISLARYRQRRDEARALASRRAGDLMLSVHMRPGAGYPRWSRPLSYALDRWVISMESAA